MTQNAWSKMVDARREWLAKYHPTSTDNSDTAKASAKTVIEESDEEEEEQVKKPKDTKKPTIEESDDEEKPTSTKKPVIEESDEEEEKESTSTNKTKQVIEESESEDEQQGQGLLKYVNDLTMKEKETTPERRTWSGKMPLYAPVSVVDFLPAEREEGSGMFPRDQKVAPLTSILKDTDDDHLHTPEEICHFICNKASVLIEQPITHNRHLKSHYQIFQKTCRMLYTNSVLQRWWSLEYEPDGTSDELVIIRARDNLVKDSEEPIFYLVKYNSTGLFVVYDCPSQMINNEKSTIKEIQDTPAPVRFTIKDNVFAIQQSHEDEYDEEIANAARYLTLADMLSPNCIQQPSSKAKKRTREEEEEEKKIESPETETDTAESPSSTSTTTNSTKKLEMKVQELERKIKRQRKAFDSEKNALVEENHALLRKVYNLTEQLKNK